MATPRKARRYIAACSAARGNIAQVTLKTAVRDRLAGAVRAAYGVGPSMNWKLVSHSPRVLVVTPLRSLPVYSVCPAMTSI